MRGFVFPAMVLAIGGCDRGGHTKARIDAEISSPLLWPPVAIEIDPRLVESGAVRKNETWHVNGMELRQHIVVNGPIRIVPAEEVLWRRPLTQPATQEAAK